MQQEWERIQSEILPAKLLKDNLNLSECFDVKENVNSDFAYVTLTKTHDMLGDNYLNCKRRFKNLLQNYFLQ